MMNHPKEHDLDWNVLDRYFSGETSIEETARAERSMERASGPELLRSTREIWDAAGVITALSAPDVDLAWRSMIERAALPESRVTNPQRTRPILSLGRRATVATRRWYRSPALSAAIAASVMAVAGVAGMIRFGDSGTRTARALSASAQHREFATRRAQRADLYLADGSRVVLNVDSRLRVPTNFGKHSREVTLVGEAYFEVASDSARPFRVITAGGIADVAGTVFVVSHYPESDAMRVGVASGVVIVRHDTAASESTTLSRDDVARIDRSGQVTLRRGVNMDEEIAWTEGRLVFNRVPLRDAVPRLARWLDADIRLGDSALGSVRYTASVSNEAVDQVLELLAATIDARVQGDQRDGYVLHSKRYTQ